MPFHCSASLARIRTCSTIAACVCVLLGLAAPSAASCYDRGPSNRQKHPIRSYLDYLDCPTCSGEPESCFCLHTGKFSGACGCGRCRGRATIQAMGLEHLDVDPIAAGCPCEGDSPCESACPGGHVDWASAACGCQQLPISEADDSLCPGDCDADECSSRCGCGRRGSLILFTGADSWHGVGDNYGLFTQNNNGVHSGINFGTPLGLGLEGTGWGAQVGSSVGVYDFTGRNSVNATQAQVQVFLTYGLYHRATCCSPWNVGVVNDWMFNDNFGVLAQRPNLDQWRGSVARVLNPCNEIGVWGTIRDRREQRDFVSTVNQTTVSASYRAVSQLNLFHHRHWECGGETWFWSGMLQRDRLSGNGSIGDWTIGAMANVPLNDRVAIYTSGEYVRPSAHRGLTAASDEYWNLSVGIAFYPRCNARANTITGDCAGPLLNVANNGNFLVDTGYTPTPGPTTPIPR